MIIYLKYYNTPPKKRGIIMCTALNKIRGRSAEEILEDYGLINSVPVDIKKLLHNIGISAIGRDFSDLESLLGKEKGSILGLLVSNGENAAIFYRKSDSYNRQRFTIAHELAHAMIHFDNSPHIEYRLDQSEIENNPTEKKANIIAGELLIPFEALKQEYMKLSMPSSPVLANIFDVSVNVMEARLEHLGIYYQNRKGEFVTYDS